jgi:hypothetical protein
MLDRNHLTLRRVINCVRAIAIVKVPPTGGLFLDTFYQHKMVAWLIIKVIYIKTASRRF